MKYDVVIIGGGLAGLTCGIRLQKAGKKCAIVSAGQSALHFSSGSFDLLDRLPDGTEVKAPISALDSLGPAHPYSVLGKARCIRYIDMIPGFLASCGIMTSGSSERNSYRISPTGELKATWLSLADFSLMDSRLEKSVKSALIVNIAGYLDFNTRFIAESLEKRGTQCRIENIVLEELERLRKNPSEMRSTNIARVMDRENVWQKAVEQINGKIKDEDIVFLPAVFGLKDSGVLEQIRSSVKIKTMFVATMPPSVPGIRTQMRLRSEFECNGGTFFMGDKVTDAEIDENGRISSIGTQNFGDIRIEADNYVLASGSFFSKGLTSSPEGILEPVFGIDLYSEKERSSWFDMDFWKKQNYIAFGAKVNERLKASVEGRTIENLYAIGSILGGSNTLYEGCGGGIAMITALAAADEIINGSQEA